MKRKTAKIIAVVLAVLFILPIIIAGIIELIPTAGAVTQADINKRKAELAALRANRQQTQTRINSTRGLRSEVIQLKVLYDEQILMIEQDIELTMELIADISLAIASSQNELDQAREREAELDRLFVERVKAMESMGEISYMSILLGAASLTDFLARWEAVREIMLLDRKLAEELIAARLEIEEAIVKLDEDRKEQNEQRMELAGAQVELAQLSAEAGIMMAEYGAELGKLQTDERQLAEAEAKTKKELDEMEETWKKIQEELARRNNPFVGGEYHWPVPGHTRIGSGFGMRLHPVFRVRRMHNGIDVGAPSGTPIVAANDGTIITRAYNSGYGNYIVIDHGGRQATLYAHMSRFANNKVGDGVKRGDIIGYVGSTGTSTGPHLHFEISINGERVDPEPRLRGR
jgi:murein DD-endopeptidase MepM/ murein hydrolase activator NlpD